MRYWVAVAASFALAACGFNGTDGADDGTAADRTANRTVENLADGMASDDERLAKRDPALDIADPEPRPTMQAQVMLDRLGFGPGVIDGEMGLSTRNALEGYQEANGLAVTGELDDTTRGALAQWSEIAATRVVRIPQEWGEDSYVPMPDDPAEQAEMERLGYVSLDERLAERFHTTIEVLELLNPGGRPAGAPGAATSPAPATEAEPSDAEGVAPLFRPGQIVRVPNIGADKIEPDVIDNEGWLATLVSLGVGTEQPELARLVVSKSGGTLKGYDEAGKLVTVFTVTTGSRSDPLPLGEWKILGKAFNPTYSYDPALLRNTPADAEKAQLPAGPNSPVGVVWIDLSKEHYGIHGTPEPQNIGRSESNGCVRLTNWDAARLAQMVSQSTQVVFEA
jgi:lipoprotein-anchoring transpeptidase ErfK/SrfK